MKKSGPREKVRAPPAVTLAIEPAKFWTENGRKSVGLFEKRWEDINKKNTPKDRTLGHYCDILGHYCWTLNITVSTFLFYKFVAGGVYGYIMLYHVISTLW
jgi:hypothetical protein